MFRLYFVQSAIAPTELGMQGIIKQQYACNIDYLQLKDSSHIVRNDEIAKK